MNLFYFQSVPSVDRQLSLPSPNSDGGVNATSELTEKFCTAPSLLSKEEETNQLKQEHRVKSSSEHNIFASSLQVCNIRKHVLERKNVTCTLMVLRAGIWILMMLLNYPFLEHIGCIDNHIDCGIY